MTTDLGVSTADDPLVLIDCQLEEVDGVRSDRTTEVVRSERKIDG